MYKFWIPIYFVNFLGGHPGVHILNFEWSMYTWKVRVPTILFVPQNFSPSLNLWNDVKGNNRRKIWKRKANNKVHIPNNKWYERWLAQTTRRYSIRQRIVKKSIYCRLIYGLTAKIWNFYCTRREVVKILKTLRD